MRKLATIREIKNINPIEGADAIECASVDGWKVVVKKGEFSVGELAIYIEVDSWVSCETASFLGKGKEPREFNGIKGDRLRTVKLRGQISQGLLLPIKGTKTKDGATLDDECIWRDGDDVSDILGIIKYEPPVPAKFAGIVRGNFPSFIPKTDQERIQNLGKELVDWSEYGDDWEVTEKLDGSSMTVYLYQGEFGVCSRNIDLVQDASNPFWSAAISNNLKEKMLDFGFNIAFQGELVGEGIQGNRYKLGGRHFYLFDIYDIDAGRYLNSQERYDIATEFSLLHCPILPQIRLGGVSQFDLLQGAEGKSELNNLVEREGIVVKCIQRPDLSFKAISNKFLLQDK